MNIAAERGGPPSLLESCHCYLGGGGGMVVVAAAVAAAALVGLSEALLFPGKAAFKSRGCRRRRRRSRLLALPLRLLLLLLACVCVRVRACALHAMLPVV